MSPKGRLCCKTRKYRLNKILAKVLSSPVLVRTTFLKPIGGPLNESDQVDMVPASGDVIGRNFVLSSSWTTKIVIYKLNDETRFKSSRHRGFLSISPASIGTLRKRGRVSGAALTVVPPDEIATTDSQ